MAGGFQLLLNHIFALMTVLIEVQILSGFASPVRYAIIFLHGSGDTGSGFQDWIVQTDATFLNRLSRQGFSFQFPTASARPYSLAGGAVSSVWHDRKELSPFGVEDTDGLISSIAKIDDDVESIIQSGIDAKNVFIFGMSMGGHLALQMSVHSKFRGDIGGIVALSCFIGASSQAWDLLQTRLDEGARIPPIRMFHGGADSMVRSDWGEATAHRLQSLGLDVSFTIERGLGHSICDSELRETEEWIAARLQRSVTEGASPSSCAV